ncbi:MAG: ATP-grasp domain-containing protein [Candidatus Omnitrophica bacterium]|nr:ATP-grasp domain-containing protein [Candidatus Omnitrophota bacterium]
MKALITIARENNAREDNADALRCAGSIVEALAKKSISGELLFVEPGDFLRKEKEIIKQLKKKNPDCIFNLFEGFSNDARKEIVFARILENSGIPFTGNNSKTLRRCLNKNDCKNLLAKAGIPVPEGICLKPGEELNAQKVALPAFIKPCCEDASVGIDKDALVFTKEDLSRAVSIKLKNYPAGLIVEEFLPDKEFNVSFIGRPPYEMLGVSSMDFSRVNASKPFMSYEAKWLKQSTDFNKLIPDVIDRDKYGELEKEIVDLCRKAAQAIGCESYFRVDLRQKDDKVFIIDINPNPDINTDSGFAHQAYSAGYSYEEIIHKIVCLTV